MKAVFLDHATMGPGLDLTPLRNLFAEFELFDASGEAEIAARIEGAEFVLTNKVKLTGDLLRAAPALRFIGLTATGTDNIDLATARKRSIAVTNIRDYCTPSVVEHVIGSLLMLTHNLARYDRSVRAGDWQQATNFCMLQYPIRELAGMTLGIIGFGALGQGVAKAAAALGMQVLVAARPGTENPATGRIAFDDLLQRSDVISLHCPLTEATRGLFSTETFARMRPGAILVNTARGALVDSRALVAALSSGQLSGAAIDVLANEPPIAGDPLLEYRGENLVLTPHIAWGTATARQSAINELAANVAAFLQGAHRNRIV